MAQNEGLRAYTAGEDLAAHRRVKIESGTTTTPPEVVYADAGEQHIGVTEYAVDDGDLVTIRLRTYPGTVEITGADAFSAAATLYGAADGKVSDTSSGSSIGIAHEACTAAGDEVEVVPFAVLSTTAGTVSIADAGNFTTTATVEAATQEIYQDLLSAQCFQSIALHSVRETTNLNVGNIAANGGLLASDTTPILSAINGATDGCQRLAWAASNSDQITFQCALPPDLNDAAAVVLHVRAAMAGATDTPTIALASYFNEADTAVADASGAITGTDYAEYTATIAAADVPAGAQTLTVGLTPGAHTTDALYVTALWLEYTRTLRTS